MIELARQPGSVVTMPKPPYLQVVEALRERIADRTYPPGSRLPTRKQLMAEFDVSDPTIGAAMRILAAEGLVETVHGIGVYVRREPGAVEPPADPE